MTLLFLYVDYVDLPNGKTEEQYGICVGDDDYQQFIETKKDEDNWIDTLRELTRRKKIVSRDKAYLTPFRTRLKFILEN